LGIGRDIYLSDGLGMCDFFCFEVSAVVLYRIYIHKKSGGGLFLYVLWFHNVEFEVFQAIYPTVSDVRSSCM
jgi:hypothetical protein